uniref:NADP-dependent oxidoreductase domain-containing protein n=1 Tax=Timema monikensis TaxID=170555 RepID=A0A7R9HVQ5_9NEOP|nr:unnamed protein product [Timema monikensis]
MVGCSEVVGGVLVLWAESGLWIEGEEEWEWGEGVNWCARSLPDGPAGFASGCNQFRYRHQIPSPYSQRSTPEELETALETALEEGYRHIDTAYVYQNEDAIGRVLSRWLSAGKVTRDELFIVTKLPPVGNRPEGVSKYLGRSLKSLGLDYVDLYLVHVPYGFKEKDEELTPTAEDGSVLLDNDTDHAAIWKAMEEEVTKGRTKAIGLSNFNEKQIERVLKGAVLPPANLQVELHIYFQQRRLVEFCKKHDITVCAYSPLGSRGTAGLLSSKELPDLMDNPVVKEIAERLSRTPAQVLLRHTVQRGIAVIPKSTNKDRIRQNFKVLDFTLSDEDVSKLDALDQGPVGRIVDFSFFKGETAAAYLLNKERDKENSEVVWINNGKLTGLIVRY